MGAKAWPHQRGPPWPTVASGAPVKHEPERRDRAGGGRFASRAAAWAGELCCPRSLGHRAREPESSSRALGGQLQALSGLGLALGRSVQLGHCGHTHQPVLEGWRGGLPLTKLRCAWPSAGTSNEHVQGPGRYLWLGGRGPHSYCPEAGVGGQQPECSWHPVPSTPALALLLPGASKSALGPLLWSLGSAGSPGPPLGHAFGLCAFWLLSCPGVDGPRGPRVLRMCSRERMSAWRTGSGIRNLQQRWVRRTAASRLTLWPTEM